MAVTIDQWKDMIGYSADLLSTKTDEFCKLDSVIGDGDHGVTIGKISNLMKEKIKQEYGSAAELFEDLGWAVTNVQGGSAGPLWGSFIMGMGNAGDGASVAETFEAGLREIESICKARTGDKTMMDAIIPGVEAMKQADGDAQALKAGAEAAAQGAEDTIGYVARFGRAKNYGERSVGTKDAGACSIATFFEGMKAGYTA